MKLRKTKIVLDADVIINFMEADRFSMLPEIFPEYEYLILDVVYHEIAKNSQTKNFIDKYLHFFSYLWVDIFVLHGESLNVYFLLQGTLCLGRMAWLVCCKETGV